jgi:TetR/AcrR family transcriptional repressor of bet genes
MKKQSVKRPARKRQRLTPEARREALLAAARRCLSTKGSKGFNLQSVADEANASLALILHYFGTADGLLQAVFDSVMFELPEIDPGSGKTIEEALERLRDLITRNFSPDYYSRGNLLIWLPIYEAMLLDKKLRQRLRKIDEDYASKVAASIARIAELRGLTVNSEHVAYNLLAFLDGLWIRWCHSSRTDTDYEQAAAYDYLELILGPVRPQKQSGLRQPGS